MGVKGFIRHKIQIGSKRLFVATNVDTNDYWVILQTPEGSELLVKTSDKTEAEDAFIEALNDLTGGDSDAV